MSLPASPRRPSRRFLAGLAAFVLLLVAVGVWRADRPDSDAPTPIAEPPGSRSFAELTGLAAHRRAPVVEAPREQGARDRIRVVAFDAERGDALPTHVSAAEAVADADGLRVEPEDSGSGVLVSVPEGRVAAARVTSPGYSPALVEVAGGTADAVRRVALHALRPLRVRVRDRLRATPVAGARVAAVPTAGDAAPAPAEGAWVESDAQGVAVLPVSSVDGALRGEALLDVAVLADGYALARHRYAVSDGVEAVVYLGRARVLDFLCAESDGSPVAGAELRAGPGEVPVAGPILARTGVDGRATANVELDPAGGPWISVEARARGHRTTRTVVSSWGPDAVTIVLQAAGGAGIRVVDAAGAPLAGLEVAATEVGPRGYLPRHDVPTVRTTSDADGRAHLEGVATGIRLSVVVRRGASRVAAADLDADELVRFPTLVVDDARTRRVRVVDARGRAVAGCAVAVVASDPATERSTLTASLPRLDLREASRSGEDGVARVLAPASGGALVVGRAPGSAWAVARLSVGAAETALHLEDALPIEVLVTDQEGRPVPGARVGSEGGAVRDVGVLLDLGELGGTFDPSAVTDDRGVATAFVTALRQTIRAQGPTGVSAAAIVTPNVVHEGRLRLVLPRRREVRVRCVDPTGAPVAGATVVTVCPLTDETLPPAVTDEDGRCVILPPVAAGDLPATTPYTLIASGAARGERVVALGDLHDDFELRVERLPERVLEVTVRAEPGAPSHALVGRLLSQAGYAVADPVLCVPGRVARFRHRTLASESLRLALNPGPGLPTVVSVPPGTTTLEVPLQATARLRLTSEATGPVRVLVSTPAAREAWRSRPVRPGETLEVEVGAELRGVVVTDAEVTGREPRRVRFEPELGTRVVLGDREFSVR